MTTDEASMLYPLMEDMMQYSGKLSEELSEGDIEYLKRELSSHKNLLNQFKTNVNKLKLGGTDLSSFSRSTDEINHAFIILGDDYARAAELTEKRENATKEEREKIDSELQLIAAETGATLMLYGGAAEKMADTANASGLNTSSLTPLITMLKSMTQNLTNMTDIGNSSIIFTINPMSGIYGDSITIFGRTLPKTEVTISYGNTTWGNVTSNELGDFSKSLKIGNMSAGEQMIILSANDEISKPAWLDVRITDTKLSIKSVKQNKTEYGTEAAITGVLSTEKGSAVISAPVSVINADDGTTLCTTVTDSYGIWTASAILPDGTYKIYADFSDITFPLNPSQSEETEFTVRGFSPYCLLLLVLAGCGAFVIWRIVRRKKKGDESENEDTKDAFQSAESAGNEFWKSEIDDIITSEPLREAEPLPYPAGLSAAETMREIYRCVIYALANKYGIEHIDAKTPREICALFAPASKELTLFMNTYEYFRYSGVAVTDTGLAALKETAAAIPELAKENKPQEDTP